MEVDNKTTANTIMATTTRTITSSGRAACTASPGFDFFMVFWEFWLGYIRHVGDLLFDLLFNLGRA